jgi:cytoskeleton protein RodZ
VPNDLKRIPRPVEATGAEAARLGIELREARHALGISVAEIAGRLRIRRAHLEALEEGRLRDLPGAAYAVGFVRSYAAALGLDPDEMARRFRDLTGTAAVKPRLVFPEPVPDRGMPAGLMIGVGAMVAVGAYVAWFNWSGGGSRMVDVVPPVPPRLEAAAEQGRAQLPVRDAAAPGPLPLAALPPPGGAGANTSAQAATVPAAPMPAAIPPAAPAATPASATPAPAAPAVAAPAAPAVAEAPPLPETARVVLRARAGGVDGAWVQVRDPRSGQVLLNRVLRPGETWPVPVRAGLLLDTGKANDLEILLDGQPQPTLEGVVGVRRNIVLEPDRLRQRLIPATATPGQSPTGPGRS